ncbi:MAG TPA: family 20 glycosylhydrolase [Candidatus Baltobacteraceae bacterium]|nr:family 20 glycosylhydrolase [Candidatus Baltobacteraceae bacterium]
MGDECPSGGARVIAAVAAAALLSADALGIVPAPQSVQAFTATYAVPRQIAIAAQSPDERNVAAFAVAFFAQRGIAARVVSPSDTAAQLRFTTQALSANASPQAYRLHVGDDGMRVNAAAGAGLFYGLQTLEELFPANGNLIHQVEITDAPRFRWRGIHLDVSRHFFGVPVVERYIEVAAHFKLNVFHWHLTDDQGWRIQILRYPRLTQVGACRSGTEVGNDPTTIDPHRYCGFYTQAQIREVVAYAKRRYVTVVPEIEMPGHATAAVASYPWLTCLPGHYEVLKVWGGSDDNFCPTPRTFAFLRGVLSEVLALFPGPYVHIGGDEVPREAWKASPAVQRLMRDRHITTYAGVQAYFTRVIEQFLNSKHRRMVGWDEILDGGVSQTATIMSWRGISGGIAAARAGNDVVISPDPPLYLDHYQGDPTVEPLAIGGYTTLERLYNYDPMPPGLTASQQRHILGAQGNLWTEFIPTPELLFYRLLPRELAVAEMTWTPAQLRSWPSFSTRMRTQYAWLQAQNLPFHIPNPTMRLTGMDGLEVAGLQPNLRGISAGVVGPAVRVALDEAVPNAVIYYTTDGSSPSAHSTRYTAPVDLRLAPDARAELRAIAVLSNGRRSFATTLVLYRAGAQTP